MASSGLLVLVVIILFLLRYYGGFWHISGGLHMAGHRFIFVFSEIWKYLNFEKCDNARRRNFGVLRWSKIIETQKSQNEAKKIEPQLNVCTSLAKHIL